MTKTVMMSVVSIYEAKTQLPALIRRALEGEEILIAEENGPLVKLQAVRREKPVRRFGGLQELVIRMEDSFDDELKDFADYAPFPAEFRATSSGNVR